MDEYIIGDRIEPSAQPYTLTEREFTEAVGIRVYGTEGGTGEKAAETDTKYYVLMSPSDTQGTLQGALLDIGDAPIYTGYADVFVIAGGYPIKEALSALADDPNTPEMSITKLTIHETYPFSFIYEGGTHMTTVTERIAKITVSGSETVKFNPVYPVIAIKGDNIDATLIKDIAADATEGVYSTSDGDGYTIIDNHTCKDTLYLSGTGDVRIWGGTDANKCPFTSDITGGEDQPWQPLQDGYSNFWFELTNDTLSPWLNFSAKNNDAVIDWGDGSGEVALDTLTPTHTYAKAGKYVVKVKGVTEVARQNVEPLSGEYLGTLKYIELNSEVVGLQNYAFHRCVGLADTAIPNGVTIGTYAFGYTSSLVKCPNITGITNIPNGFMVYALSHSRLTLAEGVTQVGSSSFHTNSSLRYLSLPSTIASIGQTGFGGASSLSEIHIAATTPPTLGTNAFSSLPSDYIIYVPIGYGETYKAAAGWDAYADHILEEGTRMSASQLRKIQNEIKTEGEEKI